MFLLCSLFNIQHCSTQAIRSVSNMLVSSANLWTTGNITMPFGIYHWDTSYIMHRGERYCIKREDLRCSLAPVTWPFYQLGELTRFRRAANHAIPNVVHIISVILSFVAVAYVVTKREPVKYCTNQLAVWPLENRDTYVSWPPRMRSNAVGGGISLAWDVAVMMPPQFLRS